MGFAGRPGCAFQNVPPLPNRVAIALTSRPYGPMSSGVQLDDRLQLIAPTMLVSAFQRGVCVMLAWAWIPWCARARISLSIASHRYAYLPLTGGSGSIRGQATP